MYYMLCFNVSFHVCELESTPKFSINNELRDSAIPIKRHLPYQGMNERSLTLVHLLAGIYPVHLCVRLNRGVVGDHDDDGRHAEGNASRLVKLRGVSLYNIVGGRQACEPLCVGLVHRGGRKNPSSFTRRVSVHRRERTV